MSEPIDYDSRSILEYAPNIAYVEPDVVSEEPEEFYAETPKKEDKVKKAKSLQKFAQNIEAIAEKVQDQADELSKGFEVKLKAGTSDMSAIGAMRRHYPGNDSKKITYEEYKQCKEHLRKLANGVSDKVLEGLSDEAIEDELNIVNSQDMNSIIGLVSPNETNRPEEDPVSNLIPVQDIEEFQDLMMRYLINALWKMFIKPALSPMLIGIPIPDEIAEIPKGAPTPSEMMGKD